MKAILILAAAASLTACTVVPASTALHACELLHTASNEADLAPGWYLQAGEVLERCGQADARAAAKLRACFAEARNGYRASAECEAME